MSDTITTIVDHFWSLLRHAEEVAAQEARERRPLDGPPRLNSGREDARLALEREVRERLKICEQENIYDQHPHSISEICRITHVQNCHICENMDCTDNLTPWAHELRLLRRYWKISLEIDRAVISFEEHNALAMEGERLREELWRFYNRGGD